MSEPRCIEAGASVSIGGRVQLKKYELSQDYHVSLNAKYEIPEDWTDEQAENFRNDLVGKLRAEIEPHADAEVQALFDAKEELNRG